MGARQSGGGKRARGAALREGSPPTVFVAGDGDVVHGAQLEAGTGEDLQLHGTQHTRLDICREHTRQASRRTSYESPREVNATTGHLSRQGNFIYVALFIHEADSTSHRLK